MTCLEERCFSTRHLNKEKNFDITQHIILEASQIGLTWLFKLTFYSAVGHHFTFLLLSFISLLCLYSWSSNVQEDPSLTFSVSSYLIILQGSAEVQPLPSSLPRFFLCVSSGLCYVHFFNCFEEPHCPYLPQSLDSAFHKVMLNRDYWMTKWDYNNTTLSLLLLFLCTGRRACEELAALCHALYNRSEQLQALIYHIQSKWRGKSIDACHQ